MTDTSENRQHYLGGGRVARNLGQKGHHQAGGDHDPQRVGDIDASEHLAAPQAKTTGTKAGRDRESPAKEQQNNELQQMVSLRAAYTPNEQSFHSTTIRGENEPNYL